jgi:hypothetical protein
MPLAAGSFETSPPAFSESPHGDARSARPRGEPQPFDFLVGLVDLRAAFVASARRARRSFFFCWPLRRVIFSELRLSNRPIVVFRNLSRARLLPGLSNYPSAAGLTAYSAFSVGESL